MTRPHGLAWAGRHRLKPFTSAPIALVVAALLAAPALLVHTAGAAPVADDCGGAGDAGDTRDGARLLDGPAAACVGALDRAGGDRYDWYAIPALPGQFVEVAIRETTSSPVLVGAKACIFNPYREGAIRCSGSLYFTVEVAEVEVDMAGDWLVRVAAAHSSQTYALSIVVRGVPQDGQNDCGSGGDASDTFDDATVFDPPYSYCEGFLDAGDDSHDWYRFDVPPGSIVSASIYPNAGEFALCLHAPDEPTAPIGCAATFGTTFRTGDNHTETRSFRAHVAPGSSNGTYSLRIEVETPPRQSDCGLDEDAPDTFENATPLALPTLACEGRIDFAIRDYDDWYRFDVEAGQTITVLQKGVSFILYDAEGDLVAWNLLGTGTVDTMRIEAKTSGAWRIEVRAAFFFDTYIDGDYELTLDVR